MSCILLPNNIISKSKLVAFFPISGKSPARTLWRFSLVAMSWWPILFTLSFISLPSCRHNKRGAIPRSTSFPHPKCIFFFSLEKTQNCAKKETNGPDESDEEQTRRRKKNVFWLLFFFWFVPSLSLVSSAVYVVCSHPQPWRKGTESTFFNTVAKYNLNLTVWLNRIRRQWNLDDFFGPDFGSPYAYYRLSYRVSLS